MADRPAPARAGKFADEGSDTITNAAPDTVCIQKLKLFKNGKETSSKRADLQRHDKVHQSRDEGHRHKENHDDAVRRENLVKMVCEADTPPEPLNAIACCSRIMIASEKPRSSITKPRMMYMMPIFLWSMLVNQSRHR